MLWIGGKSLSMDYKLIIIALGLLFIIEGIPYFAFPEKVKKFMAEVINLSDTTIRGIGLLALLLGLLLVFLGTRVLH